jgi:hypothetical protein
MVAYSIYKNCKIAYIDDYSKKHGKPPQDSDLDAFHLNSLSEPQIELYKGRAEKIIHDFVVKMAQDEVNQIAQQMHQLERQMEEEKRGFEQKLNHEKSYFIKRIDDLKPPKWYIGVLQSIVAAFIVLLCYIVIVVHFNLFGLNDGVEKRVVDKTTQEIQKQPPPK